MSGDKWLNVEIQINNGVFQSIDNTDYSDLSEPHHYVFHRLQYVKDEDDFSQVAFAKWPADTIEDLSNPWEVPNQENNSKETLQDGLYYYQKVILPTESHTMSNENESIWYDVDKNKICILDKDVDPEEDDEEGYTEYDPETQFDDVYEYIVRYESDNYFHFDQFCFSMYNLIKCYIMIERKRINNYLRNNCKKPCIDLENNMDPDLLLSIIIVLDYLIHKEYDNNNFFEAFRIFNRISSCGNLCTDLKLNNGECGCGGAKN